MFFFFFSFCSLSDVRLFVLRMGMEFERFLSPLILVLSLIVQI